MQNDRSIVTGTLCGVVAAFGLTATAAADLTPFTEHFDSDAASWFNLAGDAPVDWQAGGGPGGAGDGFVSTSFNFGSANADDPFVMFRGQDEFNSSGGAFFGDWITDGVTELSFWVRHDAPVPMNFFSRIATPANFPAVNAIAFAPVLPNTWTEISFSIDPSNPAFIFEGPASTFGSVFSNVGHVQIGFSTPAALAGGGTFTFDLDAVSVVPAPSACVLLGGLALFGKRRRRGRSGPGVA